MTITAAVRSILLTLTPVTTLVAQRVYVLMLPQSPVLPAIRVQRIDENESMHLRGPDGLYRARVQIDSVGAAGAQAETIDEAVHGNGVTTGLRTANGTTIGTITIKVIEPAGVRTLYDADELKQYKVARDYMISYATL